MVTCLIPSLGITIYGNRGCTPNLNSDLPGSLSRVYAHRETGHEASEKGPQLSNEGHGKKDIQYPSVQGSELAKQGQRVGEQ